MCYNSLEGSLCSNPHNPYTRIKEAKAMIDETINRRAREKILKNVADTLDDNNTEV